jgi:hypothetical protein
MSRIPAPFNGPPYLPPDGTGGQIKNSTRPPEGRDEVENEK